METIQSKLKEISKDFNHQFTASSSPHMLMENLFNEEIESLKNIILKHLPESNLEINKISGNEKGGLYSILDKTGIKKEEENKRELLKLYEEAIKWTKKELDIEETNISFQLIESDSEVHAALKDPELVELKDYKILNSYKLLFNLKHNNLINIFHEMVHLKQYKKGELVNYLHDKHENHPHYCIGYIWKGENYTLKYHNFRRKESSTLNKLRNNEKIISQSVLDKLNNTYKNLPWEKEAFELEEVLLNKFIKSLSQEQREKYKKHFKI